MIYENVLLSGFLKMEPVMTRDHRKEYAARKLRIATNTVGEKCGRPANTADVLWSKVEIKSQEECWPWKGYVCETGYGRTWINDKPYYAHRVIFNLANPNTIELKSPTNRKATGFLMHTCDNRVCCNPAHLKLATIKENNQDCINKGRKIMPSGADHHRSVFTNDEIILALEMRKSGQTATQIAAALNKKRTTIKSLLHRRRDS